MSSSFQNIQNIIFDLGGVILNIDYNKTEQAFVKLGFTDFNEFYSQFHATSLFADFEKGNVSDRQFIDELKQHTKGATDEEIIHAWNAMLLDYPSGRIQFLQSVRSRYRTFLLSNTNSIHYEAVQKIYRETIGEGSLDDCFEKSYYSYVTGLRKPDKDIFELLLQETGLLPETALFIDDTPANIHTAETCGIKSLYLSPVLTVEDLFRQYRLLESGRS